MSDNTVLNIWVPGVPIPQGSKTARVMGGRAVMFEINDHKLRPWRKAVALAARAAWAGREPIAGPVELRLTFFLPRGKTVRRALPTTKPDLVKLARAVEDSLTDAQVWADDSLVVDEHLHKRYAEEAGPGVRIRVLDLLGGTATARPGRG